MVVGRAWAKKGRDLASSRTLASRCQLCSPPGLPWNGTGGLWAMGDRMGQMGGAHGGRGQEARSFNGWFWWCLIREGRGGQSPWEPGRGQETGWGGRGAVGLIPSLPASLCPTVRGLNRV